MDRASARPSSPRRGVTVLMALLMVGTAAAEVYRSVLPDGSIVYSDSPPPEAAQTDAVSLPPLPTPEQRAEAAAIESALEQASDTGQDADRDSVIRAADADARKAEKDLAVARKRLEAGKVEAEGDRIGKVGGGARLTDAYWQRVGTLELEVRKAEERLEAAREAARQARH